jgi:hypothetical protein
MKKISLVSLFVLAAPLYAADPAMPAAPAAGSAATPTAQPAAAAPATTPPAAAPGTVARSQFTTAIQNNEPADNVQALDAATNRVYFFTELRGMQGQTVTHRWELNGKVVHEQPLDVGAERWRTYSNKTINPDMAGEWKVSVIGANGETLSASTISMNAAAPAPSNIAPAAPGGAAPAQSPAPATRY